MYTMGIDYGDDYAISKLTNRIKQEMAMYKGAYGEHNIEYLEQVSGEATEADMANGYKALFEELDIGPYLINMYWDMERASLFRHIKWPDEVEEYVVNNILPIGYWSTPCAAGTLTNIVSERSAMKTLLTERSITVEKMIKDFVVGK